MDLGTNGILILAIGVPIAVLLAGVLLKAACDLCSVEPPPHLVRCLVLGVVLAGIAAPLGYGAMLAGKSLGSSDQAAAVIAVAAFLPVFAAISILVFVVSLSVRPLKGARIWLVQTMVNLVVAAVGLMLVVGGWTTVESLRRLF